MVDSGKAVDLNTLLFLLGGNVAFLLLLIGVVAGVLVVNENLFRDDFAGSFSVVD